MSRPGLPDYMFAPDFFSRAPLLPNMDPASSAQTETSSSQQRTTSLPLVSNSSQQRAAPHPLVSSSSQPRAPAHSSSSQQRPLVPGAPLLMSQGTVAASPNVATQTIGAPTSLGKLIVYNYIQVVMF